MRAPYPLLIAVLAACGNAAERPAGLPAGEAAELLINRNWIDVWPTSEDERLHVFRFTPSMGGGVYQDRTLFAGSFELFTYEIDGDVIEFGLPHRKQRARAHFAIERVSGPAPFDLRLTLDPTPRGPMTYYGRLAEGAAGDQYALPPLTGGAGAAASQGPASARGGSQ